MGKHFTIAITDDCQVCGAPIDRSKNKRIRSYCSTACREKRNRRRTIESGWSREYQRKRSEAIAAHPAPGKKRCIICGRWYTKVGAHVYNRHHILAKEYRKLYNLPLKRGILSDEKRREYANNCLTNGTAALLAEVGKRTRYRPGDPRAKAKKGTLGRKGIYGSKGYPTNDYY